MKIGFLYYLFLVQNVYCGAKSLCLIFRLFDTM